MANKEEHKTLFLGLVQMLSISAMQQLGKIINPMTGKSEVSLEGAQATIDLLSMLKTKTHGNLDKDEERTLDNILASLQLNYVETAAASPEEHQPEAAAASKATADTPTTETSDKNKSDQEPRFHKSYG